MSSIRLFFFFNDTATTEIYTLSLHDALPICAYGDQVFGHDSIQPDVFAHQPLEPVADRKSTRLNSSHSQISYAVFCWKKKKEEPALWPKFDDAPAHYPRQTISPVS